MGLQQVVVGNPERGVVGPQQGLDLGLVRIVQRDDLAAGRQGLERVLLVLGDLVDPDLRATALDHFNVVAPVGRQVGNCQNLGGRLDPGQPLVLGRHLPVPDPHDAAAAVDLTGEVETALARHHAQDAAGQRGMFGVVVGGDALVVEVDVEVNAAAARASADFDVRQGFSSLFDFFQVGI